MELSLNTIDSKLAGFAILEIRGDPSRYDPGFEAEYRGRYNPRCVFVYCDPSNIATVHSLEDQGFRYAECQLNLSHVIRQYDDLSDEPFVFREIESGKDLADALVIAKRIFSHDRFSLDKRFPAGFSGERYCEYVKKSFSASDEMVFGMFSGVTHRMVAFTTLRRLSETKIKLLLGGVDVEFHGSGLGLIYDKLALNCYFRFGFRRLEGTVSAINFPIMNLEISHLGFRVRSTRIVLSKWFQDSV